MAIKIIDRTHPNQNRRISDRKNYLKDVFFSIGPMVYHGKCNNISTEGARIGNTSFLNIKSGNELLIAIPFPKKNCSLKRKATIRWIENDKFGIQFYRRKNVRKKYHNKVTVFTDSTIISARINNLSKGGANIVSEKEFLFNNKSVVYVIIPFAKKEKEVTVRSIVRWIRNSQIGIQFIE
jgi:hypothetical protein